LHMPPLRERADDIPLLLNFFLEQSIKRLGRPPMHFSKDALKTLTAYSWPGNIRELENEVERAVALATTDMIMVDDLRDSIRNEQSGSLRIENASSLKETECNLILKTLETTGGNRSEAARIIGLSREGLRKKMKRYGLVE
ncbi:MAG: helix-turn-helix domain-containing protein, partial [Syntrophales bacterium]|nr:helix-turn-helix domain-containing protein [Syntrophales bacterium]